MSRKGVKYHSSWTLQDENIENVEHVSLAPEVQRELGCSVGEHVFLEYPWAYVSREAVLRLAYVTDSSFEPYRDKIEAYGGDTFLVGYSSTQLTACDFAICLTEDALSMIVKRNADISKRIRNEAIRRIRKAGRLWKSLGSELELDERQIKNTREFFEVEVRLPVESLGLNRNLSDRLSGESWDSCVELIPYEEFKNIEKKQISRMTQTHFEPRDIEMQTYPGHPKNAWTQYVYEDTLRLDAENGESGEEEKRSTEEKSEKESEENKEIKENKEGSKDASETDAEQKPAEKSPLELFLEARAQEMIDVVCYNTVMNVYVDDIEMLARPSAKIARPGDNEIIYAERSSLVYLRLTTGKVVSDVSWHPCLADYVIISYVNVPSAVGYDATSVKTESTVLLWSLTDSLQPQLQLRCQQDIYSISFCPTNGHFVVGGTASGQVIVWNIHNWIKDRDIDENNQISNDSQTRDTVTVTSALIVSGRDHSHSLLIRRIQWLPDNYRIEPSGKLTKLSTNSSCQFMTVSEDGTVGIWDLLKYSVTSQLKSSDHKDLDDTFRPTYRLDLRPTKDSFFTPLCLCLPSTSVFQEGDRRHGELDSTEVDHTRRLWISTAQGHLACCSWEGQVFDVEKTSGLEQCKVLTGFFAHDGPVIGILRSPHLEDVLLTVGGHVFAIWKDDHLDIPLFRRKSNCVYTACCWSNRPGIFVMGNGRGDVEVWDIRRRANEPVLTRTISRKPITVLSLQDSCENGLKLIGAGDCSGIFHIFEESTDCDDTIERMDWFEEYVWREIRRKKMFLAWQKDFLQTDAIAVARRQAREEEERRSKLEMTRLKLHKEHDERLKMEAEEKVRKVARSKDVEWKMRQQERMKKALLERKKFALRELEEKRQPLVSLAEERNAKMIKAQNEAALRDKHFDDFVSLQLPEYNELKEESKSTETDEESRRGETEVELSEDEVQEYLQKFYRFSEEVRKMMAEKSYVPEFNWKTFMKMTEASNMERTEEPLDSLE